MIDFTKAFEELNAYKGSEKKKTLNLDGKKYLVKFPDPQTKNKVVVFINNAFSEYIGSNIFKITGFNVQDTVLGTYTYNGKEKIVCGCVDFTNEEIFLNEFENIALSTNPDKKIDTEINDILDVIKENKNINYEETKNFFWDMFVIDALIGNTDRHNGNWEFLVNKKTNEISLAPIYDCGSCLNPLLDDEDIKSLNKTEIKNLSVNTYSCLKENGKKINYMSYVESKKNKDLNEALLRILNKMIYK